MIDSKDFINHALFLVGKSFDFINENKATIDALNSRVNTTNFIGLSEDPMKTAIAEVSQFMEYPYFKEYAAGTIFTIYNKIREIDFNENKKSSTKMKVEEVQNNLFVGELAYFCRNHLAHQYDNSSNDKMDNISKRIYKINPEINIIRPEIGFIDLLELCGWNEKSDFIGSIEILLKEKERDGSYKGELRWH